MYTLINNPSGYRVALYIRLSKEDDSEKESESVKNQRSLLMAFIEQNDLTVYGIYIDDGYSGTNFERPEFKRMICDIEAGRVNMVITKDMSRLGRDYIQTGHYMERYFPENNVRYISLLDGVDSGVDSSINDITPFKAIMNDMYAKDISKKITSVKRDKQKKGLFIGGKAPYGYKLSKDQKNTFIVDDEAAAIVRLIIQMALIGTSCRQIAVHLNERGIPPPSVYAGITTGAKGPYTGLWSSERVTSTLKNQVYTGDMVQGRMRKINYKLKKCRRLPPEEWTVVPNTHEPLVSREDFYKVQQLIESRYRTRERTHSFLLKGLLFCHECGYPLSVIMRTLSGGRETLYTICRTYQRFTKLGKCTSHCIRVDTVTDAVMQKVLEICSAYLDREACGAIVNRETEEASGGNTYDKERIRINTRIGDLTTQLDRMYVDKLSGILDDDDFKRVYVKLKTERAELHEEIKKLEDIEEFKEEPEDAAVLISLFIGTVNTNRELLVSLIERVELTEEKEIKILFRFKETEAVCRLQ